MNYHKMGLIGGETCGEMVVLCSEGWELQVFFALHLVRNNLLIMVL